MDAEGNPINFDYHLCKTNDNTNLRDSVHYCGGCNLRAEATRDKAEACGKNMKCATNDYDMNECMCADGNAVHSHAQTKSGLLFFICCRRRMQWD